MPSLTSGPVDGDALRAAAGRFATGVAVVTAQGATGPVGTTVNSFCSASLEPPLVLFCLGRRSGLRVVLGSGSPVGISVLGEGQQWLSRRFATSGADRFQGVAWRRGASQVPLLDGALAGMEATVERLVEVGDHELVVAAVTGLHPVADGGPLLFFGSAYHRIPAPVRDRAAAGPADGPPAPPPPA